MLICHLRHMETGGKATRPVTNPEGPSASYWHFKVALCFIGFFLEVGTPLEGHFERKSKETHHVKGLEPKESMGFG